jgi:hypothetical protein
LVTQVIHDAYSDTDRERVEAEVEVEVAVEVEVEVDVKEKEKGEGKNRKSGSAKWTTRGKSRDLVGQLMMHQCSGSKPTIIRLFNINAMLAERKGQVVHGEHDAITLRRGIGPSAAGSRAADAELGEVECVAGQVRDELLRREREEAFPGH